jgi:hypothetical protein
MEELSFDNILSDEEVDNLFTDMPEESESEENNSEPETSEKSGNTTEVDVEELFTDEPESVSSEDVEDKEDTDPDKKGSSSQNNFYSSIAKALQEEGIFPDLDEDVVTKANSPEQFRELIENQIKAELSERQKRVDEALGVGVEPNAIRQYENTLSYLDSLKDDVLESEDDSGEYLRKQLIYQDYINRGYSKERAQREVQKSLNGGTDIDDAKEALLSNKQFFKEQYNKLVSDAKQEMQKEADARKKQAEDLKNSILNDSKVFGELEVDKNTRKKIFDSIAKPVYKDPDSGQMLTAIQKYEMENRTDFLKNLGLIFTLTDGFKNLDGLVKGKVRKEVKKGLRDLESTINNTSRNSDGSLKFTSGVSSDPNSFIKGWKLDI